MLISEYSRTKGLITEEKLSEFLEYHVDISNRKYPVIEIWIGTDKVKPIKCRMLVDTGASFTVLAKDKIKKLGLKFQGKREIRGFPESSKKQFFPYSKGRFILKKGDESISRELLVFTDNGSLDFECFNGIAAMDFLENCLMTVDGRKEKLTLKIFSG